MIFSAVNNDHQPKAGHLRLYTSIGDDGQYMASWSEKPMADRIENHLTIADMIPRTTIAAALPATWYADAPLELRVKKLAEQWQKLHEILIMRSKLDVAIALLGLPEPATCTWTPDGDGVYNTDCGHAFVFEDGTPAENNIAFCGYCGKRLIEGADEWLN